MLNMGNVNDGYNGMSQRTGKSWDGQVQAIQPTITSGGSEYLFEALQSGYTQSPTSLMENNLSHVFLDSTQPRFSALLDVNDVVAMHLLVETAISDSTTYEILSYEEVDELKSEYNQLVGSISNLKQKLLLESKVRDAAISLSRLYPSRVKSKQTPSLIGTSTKNNASDTSMSDIVKQADDELNTSTRKCEELVLDIWRYNSRADYIQRRLLQHRAGVLGLTHHSNQHMIIGNKIGINRPSSGSVDNHKSSRSSLTLSGHPPDDFDERSLYKAPENLDEITKHTAINQKYYGLATQDRDMTPLESFKSQKEGAPFVAGSQISNRGKRSSTGGSMSSPDGIALAFTERRVSELNSRIRQFLVQAGVQIPTPPAQPQAVAILSFGSDGVRSSMDRPLSTLVLDGSPVFSLQENFDTLEQGILSIEKTARATSDQKLDVTRKLERTETILGSLWEVLISGEEELCHQKLERQRRRDERANMSDGYAKSPDHGYDSGEDDEFEQTDDEDEAVSLNGDTDRDNFSISAFSGKIHGLYERATRLQLERTSLRKQLAKQREPDAHQTASSRQEYDKTIAEFTAAKAREVERELGAENAETTSKELQTARGELQGAKHKINDLELKLQKTEDKVQQVTKQAEQQFEQADSRIASTEAHLTEALNLTKSLREQLQEKDEMIALLQGIVAELEEKLQHQKVCLESMPDDLEIERLRSDSKDHHSTKDMLRQSEDKLKLTQSLNYELEAQLHDLSTSHKNLDNLQDQIAKLKDHKEAYQEVSAEKDIRMGALESIIAQNELKLKSIEDIHAEHQAVKDDLEHTRDQLKEHLRNAALLRERDETIMTLHDVIKELRHSAAKQDETTMESQSSEQNIGQYLQKIAHLETELKILRSQTDNDKNHYSKELEQKSGQITQSETELRSLEGEVARLSTEIAILQAELDETHSASRQRIEEVRRQAAEALQAEAGRPQAAMDLNLLNELEELSRQNQNLLAQIRKLKEERQIANNNHQKDNRGDSQENTREDILKQRCDELQKELNEMLFDYETVTKASIEFEAERGKLEDMVDLLRGKVELLETNLADEKVRWLGMSNVINNQTRSQSSGSNEPLTPGIGAGVESTSITVLKSEFKKMMRDMRSEQTKQIRAEQDTRRKLENELRLSKKEYQQLLKKQHMIMIET